jgi:CheY-like chemotaxis protein
MDRLRPLEALYILIVRDGPAMEPVRTELVRLGALVRTVVEPDEAIRLLDALAPALVLVAFDEPRGPAYEFVRRLRARSPELGGRLPVVAVASSDEALVREVAETVGVDAFVGGVVSSGRLLEIVVELVAQR